MKTTKLLVGTLITLALLLLAAPGTSHADILYVANTESQNIIKFNSSGVGTVFANTPGLFPRCLAFDSAGNLYASLDNASISHYIEKFDPSGVKTIFFTNLEPDGPASLAFDNAGNLYAAIYGSNNIEEFNSSGVGTVFASGLDQPWGLAFDSVGNLYVASSAFGNGSIEKFNSSGVGTVFAQLGSDDLRGVAFDSAGNLYVADYTSNTIVKFNSSGVGTNFASSGLNHPCGLVFDSAGNLYVANNGPTLGNGTIEKFNSRGVGTVFASGLNGPVGLAMKFEPLVGLLKAVKPSFFYLTPGTNYQLQVSGDLNNWTNQGSPFTATTNNMIYPQYFDVDNWNTLFFRLQVSP